MSSSHAVEIDDPAPICLAEEHDRNGRRLAGLNEGQNFEELVDVPKPPGKITRPLARIAKCIFRMAK